MCPRIGRTLGGFHHRVALPLANIHPRRVMTGRWVYPLLDEAITAVGMEEVEKYVLRHQNTVAQYITTWLILELCLAAEQRSDAQVTMI